MLFSLHPKRRVCVSLVSYLISQSWCTMLSFVAKTIQGFISMDMCIWYLADDTCTCQVTLQQRSTKRFLISSKFWHCHTRYIRFDPRSALTLYSIISPFVSHQDTFLDEVPGLGKVNVDFQQLLVVMTALISAIRLPLRIGRFFTHTFGYCGNKISK